MERHPETGADVNVIANLRLKGRRGKQCYQSPMNSAAGAQSRETGEEYLVVQTGKNLPAMRETQVQPLGGEDALEKGKATHSSILAQRIPWTGEPGGLQSMGS